MRNPPTIANEVDGPLEPGKFQGCVCTGWRGLSKCQSGCGRCRTNASFFSRQTQKWGSGNSGKCNQRQHAETEWHGQKPSQQGVAIDCKRNQAIDEMAWFSIPYFRLD
jgi:hypothetical protein